MTAKAKVTFTFRIGKDEDTSNQKLVSLAQFLARLWSKSSWKSSPGIRRTTKQLVNLCWLFQRTSHT